MQPILPSGALFKIPPLAHCKSPPSPHSTPTLRPPHSLPQQLIEHQAAAQIYPSDAIARAREFLAAIPGGTGAYSDTKGALICRQQVAAGIERRDGFPCDPDDLFLTNGASTGVHYIIFSILRNELDCVLTPIPQYPLYSATLALYGELGRVWHTDLS
jgi:aspartate/methionine/tyrosine aminotransferase